MLARSLPDTYSIAVVTKEEAEKSNTALAQGGIAASLSAVDRPELHAQDTLLAAADHADAERVDILVQEGATIIRSLLEERLPFDAAEQGLPALGIEGAHSERRILHAGGDQTGKMLIRFLIEESAGKMMRFAFHSALELVVEEGRCTGVLVSDQSGNRSVINARYIVLATGGIGQLYKETSNSSVATGDGLSLAYHAGAILEDLEFVQFHPTVLTIKGQSCGLVSEAVRGEGALLIDQQARRIMEGIHPLLELAPRDVVARTIEWHWQNNGPVFLDARHLPDFEHRFPSIHKNCRTYDIDPATDLLPVRPGAHFHMGGVQTDSYGATSVPGLYAIGEVASTGVHGANRLASNSLLEGLVFGKRLADHIAREAAVEPEKTRYTAIIQSGQNEPFNELDSEAELKEKMTRIAGIIRDPEELKRFIDAHPLRTYTLSKYPTHIISQIHRVTANGLIAKAALLREESRGGHYRIDFPEPKDAWTGKVIELSKSGASIRERKTTIKETVQ